MLQTNLTSYGMPRRFNWQKDRKYCPPC